MEGVCIYYMVESWEYRREEGMSHGGYSGDMGLSFKDSLKHTPVGMLLAVLGFIGSLYPMLLCGLHIYLMATGQQTREFVSEKRRNQ